MKKIICTSLLVLYAVISWACDGCGCSINGMQGNLLSGFRNHAVGLQFQSVNFKGNSEYGLSARDQFRTVQVQGRYFITNRFQLSAQLPLQSNIRLLQDQHLTNNGLGDIKLFGQYLIKDVIITDKGTSLFWDLGLGLVLPTGKYDSKLHHSNLPDNFNTGKGNWGIAMQSNVNISRNYWGCMTQLWLQYQTKSFDGYQFGNNASVQTSLYRELRLNENLKLIPYAGVYAELLQKDQNENKVNVHGTGGHAVFANAGFQTVIRRVILGAGLQVPWVQNYSDHEIIAKLRWNIQLAFLFGNN